MAWRFQQYYAHKALLAHIIAPLVHETLATLRRMATAAAASSGSATATGSGSPRVAVFSGHDVTVLAFLHALGWPRVRDPTWWPPYGCALVFELLESTTSGGLGGDDYRVRIRLDVLGQRVPISLPVLSEPRQEKQQEDEDDSISLADLGRWMQEQGLLRRGGGADGVCN